MPPSSPPPTYFIGWDVGGWNCDKNANSRDAIAILNAHHQLVGTPWRGNLRPTINQAHTTTHWIAQLFHLCQAPAPSPNTAVVLAIDTPLGLPLPLLHLFTQSHVHPQPIGTSAQNPYLYRHTEHLLFQQGLGPLSPIKDMIGSQATKGRHVLARFAPHIVRCGVWQNDTATLTALEGYPSPCKHSALIQQHLQPLLHQHAPLLNHADKHDALVCALLAALWAIQPQPLTPPPPTCPTEEGWIWLPHDVFTLRTDEVPARVASG